MINKRVKRIFVVPSPEFVLEILPKAQAEINALRFVKTDTVIHVDLIRSKLIPVYVELAKALSRYFGKEVKHTELFGLWTEQNYSTGRITVRVESRKSGIAHRFNIELVPAHTQQTLIDRCIASDVELVHGDMASYLQSHEEVVSKL